MYLLQYIRIFIGKQLITNFQISKNSINLAWGAQPKQRKEDIVII